MRYIRLSILLFLLPAASAIAQLPDQDWDFEDAYRDDLLFVHSLVNYSYDLYWQLDWERRLLADNGLRFNTGSVTSTELQSLVDLNVNHDLNDKWRFQGRFSRDRSRQRPGQEDQFLVGLERSILSSSSLFLMASPEYQKEFIDVFTGYSYYRQDRQQYLRVGVLLEDVVYGTKNDLGGEYEQQPVALQWAIRLGTENWWVFSEGKVGTGFERIFPDAAASPDLVRHERLENSARLKFTQTGTADNAWSVWIDWYEFEDAKQYRQPGFDYDYTNTQINFAAEYVQTFLERHRLRLLAHYVQLDAESRGFSAHDYDRKEVLGGAFYEYLWPSSGVTFAYALGRPDIEFRSPDDSGNFNLDEYRDKLILGWRYAFSVDAQILISVSHEVSTRGFGGGNLQFQMFF